MRSMLPSAVQELTNELMRLPGIGPKSAKRLAIHLLRQPRSVVSRLGDTLKNLHANVRICERCFNLAEAELCRVCADSTRTQNVICVVESPLDVEAVERTDSYDGLYHVLGGALSPLEGIDAEQLTIRELLARIESESIDELVMALNPTLEGEATIRHIVQQLSGRDITISRLGRGLPTGGDIEFADAVTLTAALQGRTNLK